MNIDWNAVLDADAPPVTLLESSPSATRQALESASTDGRPLVRSVDARDGVTTPKLLRAIADALEFPAGNVNWNVVEEYLYDLTWLPDADGYVLVVVNCERFIDAESASGLPILDSIFAGLADDARTNPRAMPPRRLICQCAPSRRDDFATVLERYGVAWPATGTTSPRAHGADATVE